MKNNKIRNRVLNNNKIINQITDQVKEEQQGFRKERKKDLKNVMKIISSQHLFMIMKIEKKK
jgi:hypothetical protein